jgi:RNase P/RNase MRP subunit p29
VKLNPTNLARHELIGLNVQVESNSEPGIVGLRGRIVDETRNTFLLETERKVLRIPKRCQPDHHPARRAEGEGRGLGFDLAA